MNRCKQDVRGGFPACASSVLWVIKGSRAYLLDGKQHQHGAVQKGPISSLSCDLVTNVPAEYHIEALIDTRTLKKRFALVACTEIQQT